MSEKTRGYLFARTPLFLPLKGELVESWRASELVPPRVKSYYDYFLTKVKSDGSGDAYPVSDEEYAAGCEISVAQAGKRRRECEALGWIESANDEYNRQRNGYFLYRHPDCVMEQGFSLPENKGELSIPPEATNEVKHPTSIPSEATKHPVSIPSEATNGAKHPTSIPSEATKHPVSIPPEATNEVKHPARGTLSIQPEATKGSEQTPNHTSNGAGSSDMAQDLRLDGLDVFKDDDEGLPSVFKSRDEDVDDLVQAIADVLIGNLASHEGKREIPPKRQVKLAGECREWLDAVCRSLPDYDHSDVLLVVCDLAEQKNWRLPWLFGPDDCTEMIEQIQEELAMAASTSRTSYCEDGDSRNGDSPSHSGTPTPASAPTAPETPVPRADGSLVKVFADKISELMATNWATLPENQGLDMPEEDVAGIRRELGDKLEILVDAVPEHEPRLVLESAKCLTDQHGYYSPVKLKLDQRNDIAAKIRQLINRHPPGRGLNRMPRTEDIPEEHVVAWIEEEKLLRKDIIGWERNDVGIRIPQFREWTEDEKETIRAECLEKFHAGDSKICWDVQRFWEERNKASGQSASRGGRQHEDPSVEQVVETVVGAKARMEQQDSDDGVERVDTTTVSNLVEDVVSGVVGGGQDVTALPAERKVRDAELRKKLDEITPGFARVIEYREEQERKALVHSKEAITV